MPNLTFIAFFILALTSACLAQQKIYVERLHSKFAPWVRHGKIIYIRQVVGELDAAAYIYQPQDESLLVPLTNSTKGVNLMFNNEIKEIKKSRELVGGREFPPLVIKLLLDDEFHLLDESYVGRREEVSLYDWMSYSGKGKQSISEFRSLDKIQGYTAKSSHIVTESDWSFVVFYTNKKGEIWEINAKGNAFPLAITSFERKCTEQAGAITPLPLI